MIGDRTPVCDEGHQLPVFSMSDHGRCGGRLSPFVVFRAPVVGQLDHRRLVLVCCLFVARRGEKDEGVATLVVLLAADFLEAEPVAVEFEALLEVGHPDHSVQIAHSRFSFSP